MQLLPVMIGAALFVALSVGLIFGGLLKRLNTETPQQRLDRLTAGLRPLEEAELETPFLDRIIKPWLRHQIQAAGRLTPAYNIDKLSTNLMRAGYPYRLSALDFLGVKLLAALMAGTLTVVLLPGGISAGALVLPAMVAVIGFLLPDFWLGGRVRRRQRAVQRTLPDALDMLTICVDAGSSLDAAMLTISQRWKNAIAQEFGKVVAEIGIGMTRRAALQNMVASVNLPEVTSFVAVLLQADQFGLSIASVLHTQSEQMRQRRWQRAEEEARKIPTKLLFPLVFMILPALFAVTIGPAVPILMQTFAGLAR